MSQNGIIGRKDEVNVLRNLLLHKESQMVALVGRRRIGKTFLIRNVYKNELLVDFTGQRKAKKTKQLKNFESHVVPYLKKNTPSLKSWDDAFDALRLILDQPKDKHKKVLFFDELPWLATPKSGFLPAFEYFWNDYAIKKNIIIVICGSYTSWMIDNIIKDTGGLHNRVTKYMYLQPFTLRETKDFLAAKKINYPLKELIQLYMIFGGVPFYINEINKGESLHQAVQRMCFAAGAAFRFEFDNLYKALFNNFENHIAIVTVLGKSWKGFTRSEIIKYTKISNGGWLSKTLSELEASSFIKSYSPFGKSKKETLYRLVDEFTLFYLTYMTASPTRKISNWQQFINSQSYKSWSGYAFENFCFKHVPNIKKALGISGVYTEESSFISKQPRFQIDLILDRADNCINLCEIKFYNSKFNFNSSELKKLEWRKEMFRSASHTNKHLFTTLITTYGLINDSALSSIDQVITIKDIFDIPLNLGKMW